MEHLHPDDVIEQLEQVFKALKPGGEYLCITPNRLSGPHDISKYFDQEATGFHLKEYTISEIDALFKKTGFKNPKLYFGGKGWYIKLPIAPFRIFEKALELFPIKARRVLLKSKIISATIAVRIVATKT